MLRPNVILLGLILISTRTPCCVGQTESKNSEARISRIVNCLPSPVTIQGEAVECKTLASRMAELKVPGVSVAVIHNGAIEWAKGFGFASPDGTPVNETTLFQAGSISKPVSAMAALHLAQIKKLPLEGDINNSLKSWHLPPLSSAPGSSVTLRELLSHTAGISVHGFRGYVPGEPVPTLVQVLDGIKPTNTAPIRIEKTPGSDWDYSGGGFTVTHETFPQLMSKMVLNPVGMSHSTYEQPLPRSMRNSAATPYAANGKPLISGAHIYPEMAAAGLWSTPSDLGLYILDVQKSLAGRGSGLLDSKTTSAMLTPGKNHWGLGVEVGGSDPQHPYFTHSGVNEGFQSLFVGYQKQRDGAVIMTNSAAGLSIANDLMRSIAVEYGWPDFKPSVRISVKVDPTVLEAYAGTYKASPTFIVVYTLEGTQLFAQATGQKKFPIYPESETKFFMKVVDAEIEFHRDDKGKVDYLTLHQGGHDFMEVRQ